MNMVALGEVCDIIAGQSPPSEFYNDRGIGLPFFQGKTDFGEIYPSVRMYCSKPQKVAEVGDILISVRAPVGPTNLADRQCCIGRGLSAIRPSGKVDTKFLLQYFKAIEPKLSNMGNGSTFSAITQKDLRAIEIPLPPLGEQQRIAAVLDKADELRAKRRTAVARLDALLQSTFLHLFGDPVTNPMGWPVGTIDLIVQDKSDVRCGPFGTQLKVEELVDKGIPLLGIENVHNNRFISDTNKFLTPVKAKELNRFDVKNGDVLVTRMGTIGRACVVSGLDGEARISYHLFRVRPDKQKCLPEFLSSTICRSGTFQQQLDRLSHGAIMAGLSTSNLRDVKFLLPGISHQQRYINFVKKTESQMAFQRNALSKLDNLFHALQQRAFNGQL